MTTLAGVFFLAAYTTRSQAYAQAMASGGVEPESVILFGDQDRDKGRTDGSNGPAKEKSALFLPDLGEPVSRTCERMGWPVTRLEAASVNDGSIVQSLEMFGPKLVVYSGYGGQLVKPAILDLGFPLLHLHAGWLPDYRGSTTVYYSWLKEGYCAVSAFLLDKDIDTGPVVARRRYPLPLLGLDVDDLYDNAIRADLLARVLKDYASKGSLKTIPIEGEGTVYYVIHPVLKHLALLSLESDS